MGEIDIKDKEEEKYTTRIFKHLDKVVASSTVILIFVFGGFYYTTNTTLASHSDQLKIIGEKMTDGEEKKGDNKAQTARTEEQINSLKELMMDIKEHQQQSDIRLDKIYEVVIDMNKTVKKNNN